MDTWLEFQLQEYVDHGLLKSCTQEASWRMVYCLAHRFFPDRVSDLPTILQQGTPSDMEGALQILHDELGAPATVDNGDMMAYYNALRDITMESFTQRRTEIRVVQETAHLTITRTTTTRGDAELERRARVVMNRIKRLHDTLNDMALYQSHMDVGGEEDEDQESFEASMISRVEEFETSLASFQEEEYASFKEYVENGLDHEDQDTQHYMQEVVEAHAALDTQLREDFGTIRARTTLAKLTRPLRNELDFIQAHMLKTTVHITSAAIDDLEERVLHVGRMIKDIHEQHPELVGPADCDTSPSPRFEALRQKHVLVNTWVHEVRVWHGHCERATDWISSKLRDIENQDVPDGLQEGHLVDDSDSLVSKVDQLNTAHEALEKRVETFNAEDIDCMRMHVKTLTASDKNRDDLTPADTIVIEIIFTTLMVFDRLMNAIRRRSYDLQILALRVFWEQEHAKSYVWLNRAHLQVDDFLEHAQWRPDDEKHEAIRSLVVQQLLDLEHQSATFDQGQFTMTVNMYQDMDDMCRVEIPEHLEAMQVRMEQDFESLTKKLAYAREVVEQRLSLMDYVERAVKLLASGEQLKEEMAAAKKESAITLDRDLSTRVRNDQEQTLHVVTVLAPQMRYPSAEAIGRQEQGDVYNATAKKSVDEYKTALEQMSDTLQMMLEELQQMQELQKAVAQLTKDLVQLQSSVQKQLRAVKASSIDVLDERCALDKTDVDRLRIECGNRLSKMMVLKDTDAKKLDDKLKSLKRNVASTDAVSLDPLEKTMEHVNALFKELESALELRRLQVDVLQKRLEWERSLDDASQMVRSTTRSIWIWIEKTQWRPSNSGNNQQQQQQQSNTADSEKEMRSSLEELGQQVETSKSSAASVFDGFRDMADQLTSMSDDDLQLVLFHMRRQQDKLQNSLSELTGSAEFAEAVLEQRVGVGVFMRRASKAYDTGEQLISAIQHALDTIMSDNVKDDDDDPSATRFSKSVEQFGKDIEELWTQHGETVPYPTRSSAAHAARLSTQDDDINVRIKTVVLHERGMLNALYDKMVLLHTRYKMAMQLTSKVRYARRRIDHQQQQVAALMDEIDADRRQQELEMNRMKSLKDLMTRNKARVDKVDEYKKTLINLDDDCQSLTGTLRQEGLDAHVPLDGLTQALVSLETNTQRLEDMFSHYTRELGISDKRASWEGNVKDAIRQINVLADQVDTTLDSTHLASSGSDILQKHREHLKAQQDRASVINKYLESQVDPSFQLFKQEYGDDEPFPQALADQQNQLHDQLGNLSTLIESKFIELDRWEEHGQWQQSINKTMEECNHQQQLIEIFIRKRAAQCLRKGEDNDVSGLDQLKSHAQTLVDRIDHVLREGDTLAHDRKAFESHKERAMSVRKQLSGILDFAQRVNDQCATALSWLDRAHQLEEDAQKERLRIEKGDVDVDVVVERFRAKVQEICDDELMFPVRDYEEHDSAAKDLDIADNDTLHELVNVQRQNLHDLVDMLDAAVKARRLTLEKQSNVDAFLVEARSMQEWINDKLTSAASIRDIGDQATAQDIRSALALLDSLSAAVNTQQASYDSLCAKAKQLDDDIQVKQQQSTLASMWDQLQHDISHETRERLQKYLQHAEFQEVVQSVKSTCQLLESELTSGRVCDLSKESMDAWYQQLDMLKTQSLVSVQKQVSDDEPEQKDAYEALVKQHQQLCNLLDDVNTKWQEDQLIQDYQRRATELASQFSASNSRLESIRQKIPIVTGASDDNDNIAIVSAYEDEQHHVQDLMTVYDKIQALYRDLQQKQLAERVADACTHLDDEEKSLQQRIELVRSAIDTAAQWKALHKRLSDIEHDLGKIDEGSTAIEDAEEQLAAMDAQLSTIVSTAGKISNMECSGEQHANESAFQQHYDQVIAAIAALKEYTNVRKLEVKQQEEKEAVLQSANDIREQAEKERSNIHQRLATTTAGIKSMAPNQDSLADALERYHNEHTMKAAESKSCVYDMLMEELSGLSATDSDEDITSDTRQALDNLERAIEKEHGISILLSRAATSTKAANDLNSRIDDFRTRFMQYNEANISGAENVMDRLKQDMPDFTASVDDLLNSCNAMEKDGDDDGVPNILKDEVIGPCAQDTAANWKRLQDEWSRLNKQINATRHMEAMRSQCDEFQAQVDELGNEKLINGLPLEERPRAQALRALHQELNDLERKAMEWLESNTSVLDVMLADMDDNDMNALGDRQTMLDQSKEDLRAAIARKRDGIDKALGLGKCLSAVDDIDDVINRFKKTLEDEDTAADLSALYKQYEREVVQKISAAHVALEQELATGEETDRRSVKASINGLEKRWKDISQQAKGRINATDDVRKSSLPTRVRETGSSSRLPVVSAPSAQSNTSSSLLSTSSRLSSSASRLPTSSSKRRGHTHTPSSSSSSAKPPPPPPNNYKADPRNDLDVEMGKIINELSYKVTVKKVHGKVGRYWIGDINPKLAYCRILKSGMVMVRVGGGWMELREYLRTQV